MIRAVVLLIMSVVLVMSTLAGERYPFTKQQQRQQFLQLTQQLRCLVCQNESLDASNAPLAQDLKQQVYRMVRQGKSSVQIKQFMVARYGDFVLLKPQWQASTWLLWLMPLLLMLIAGMLICGIQRRQRARRHNNALQPHQANERTIE